jgi:heme oxygenase
MTDRSGLAARLRSETAELHHATEEQAGVPATVNSTRDYMVLLQRMLAFHLAAEAVFHEPRLASSWATIGIAIGSHDRSELIIRDLRALGVDSAHGGEHHASGLNISTFAEALGCLYVVEGSSLGGRFIGPAIVEKLGAVPTAYYDSDGRSHPAPWRSVKAALAEYDKAHDNCGGVIDGAIATFTFFGRIASSWVMLNEPV